MTSLILIRNNAAAEPPATLQKDNVLPGLTSGPGGRQAGNPSANDDQIDIFRFGFPAHFTLVSHCEPSSAKSDTAQTRFS